MKPTILPVVFIVALAGCGRRFPNLLLPADFPAFKVHKLENAAPGYIFLANYSKKDMDQPNPLIGRYLVILDSRMVPVWYYKSESPLGDFKPEVNGTFSFYHWNEKKYYTINYDKKQLRKYEVTGKYTYTDSHDFILRPDGSYYLSTLVDRPAGKATLTEFVLLHYDDHGRLVREWKSWEIFATQREAGDIINTARGKIDHSHFNSLDLDADGNLLVSRKHRSEVAKIDARTGKVLWRLGGASSDFRFEGDPLGAFNHQHCARFTPGGNILLYDNGKLHRPPQSRALEYALDYDRRTARLVWSFAYPGLYTEIMGSVQRLANGNTFIGWGGPTSEITFTEATKDGRVTTEVSLPGGQMSYRARKYEWQPPTHD